MFNQEPAEEPGQISEAQRHEAEPQKQNETALRENNSDVQNLRELQTQNLDYTNQKSETGNQTLELTDDLRNRVSKKSDLLKRSTSEPCSHVSRSEAPSTSRHRRPKGRGGESRRSCCSEEGVDSVLQVDNGSEVDDSFLQREGSQRRSRRRFRRVNPKGERELITDGQEPASYNTVRSNF